mgnify:CR=1 FL=1
MSNESVLKNIYKLEEVWLKHIGCKLVKTSSGIAVSSLYNVSEDFNYFLLEHRPSEVVKYPVVKIRRSDDKTGVLSRGLIRIGFKKGDCDDVQLVYTPSCRLGHPACHNVVMDGLRIEESEPQRWIENNKYDLNRDFSVGAFTPIRLLKGTTVAGRVNLLKRKRFIGIFDLFIAKEFRGAGLGRWLLSNLLRKGSGKTYFIQTWETNTAALGLYKSLGFKQVDRYLYFSKKEDVASFH